MRAGVVAAICVALCSDAVSEKAPEVHIYNKPTVDDDKHPIKERRALDKIKLERSNVSCSERWLRKPELMEETPNPDGGKFQVWKFPLAFSNYSIFWRRFGVDIPADIDKACPKHGCPIIVDFPGAYGSVFTQRAWTKWYRYQALAKTKFILITAEGSPDAVAYADDVLKGQANLTDQQNVKLVDSSVTTWNVLGWGDPSPPANATSCDAAPGTITGSSRTPGCFTPALELGMAYACYASQLATDPKTCRPWAAEKRGGTGRYGPMASGQCASTTAANDWDYVKLMLEFVVQRNAGDFHGDRRRIYFTGQSMGGMAALQFASPDVSSIYHLGQTCAGDLRPAAVVAASAGGARSSTLDLRGEVPALVMQGSGDPVAPPVVPAGIMRVPDRSNKGGVAFKAAFMTKHWKKLLADTGKGGVMRKALDYLLPGSEMPNKHRDRTAILLQADAQMGGALLKHNLPGTWGAGCPDAIGEQMAIGGDYYMWETLGTTMHRVGGIGNPMKMSTLTYTTTHGKEAADIYFQCADATEKAGSSKELRVCVFKGGHTYPFLDSNSTILHEYIWEGFLKGGTLS